MSDLCIPDIKHKNIEIINYITKKKYIFTKDSKIDKSYTKINDYIYDDDSIIDVSNKISSYCTNYGKDGNYIYLWYIDNKKKNQFYLNMIKTRVFQHLILITSSFIEMVQLNIKI